MIKITVDGSARTASHGALREVCEKQRARKEQ